jgi:hypothetical protein
MDQHISYENMKLRESAVEIGKGCTIKTCWGCSAKIIGGMEGT